MKQYMSPKEMVQLFLNILWRILKDMCRKLMTAITKDIKGNKANKNNKDSKVKARDIQFKDNSKEMAPLIF